MLKAQFTQQMFVAHYRLQSNSSVEIVYSGLTMGLVQQQQQQHQWQLADDSTSNVLETGVF